MKRAIWIASLTVLLGSAAAVVVRSASEPPPAPAGEPRGGVERLLLEVQGLTCGSCESRIREDLTKYPGIRAVGVDLGASKVTVEYAAGQADPKAIAERITRLGYPARYLASGAEIPAPGPVAPKSKSGCGGKCCDRSG